LAAVLGAAEITGLTRLSGGASRDTWRFEADGTPLILQRQRDGDERDMTIEIAAVRAAGAAGVPTATLVAGSTDREPLGAAYMILTRVDGETTARKLLRDDEFDGARRKLPAQLAQALAKIHAIDPTSIPGVVEIDQVERYREVLDELRQPHPTFELAFRWLEANRPPIRGGVVVHGDFRLGNVIVDHDGLRAVLDWELVHLGDPMEDLGWLCVKAWRFGSAHPVAGVGEYQQLFDAYVAAGGRAVDAADVRWWEVLGTLKWGIMCIMQANAHLSGMSRSHELAAIGRRVCENEHDLFLALEGHW
ncbi:MAG TPA: phosphotransferase family protein, partial [Ilumatobacteraceae bacterium]|nr:phosphotransferase family protein [Ilumatobacteraceae bacterium]